MSRLGLGAAACCASGIMACAVAFSGPAQGQPVAEPTPRPRDARNVDDPPPPPPEPAKRPGADTRMELTIDLRGGTPSPVGDGRAQAKTRLQAAVFALNSINKTSGKLLKVDELLEQAFPPNREIPKEGEAKVKIDLQGVVSVKQRPILQQLLAADPLTCGRGDRALAQGVRADTLARVIFKNANYRRLLGLNDSREDWERDLGLVAEQVDAERVPSQKTLRVLLPPGQSGIVHPETYRELVLRTTRYGGLAIQTNDTDKENGTDPQYDYAGEPVRARRDASEAIWELPNGMRAYDARSADGAQLASVPPGIVTEPIFVPTSCMECHSGAYMATSGRQGSTKGKDITAVKFHRNLAEAKKLFPASFVAEYERRTKAANLRYSGALEDSGSLRTTQFTQFLSGYSNDVTEEELAREVGVRPEVLRTWLLGDPRLLASGSAAAWKRAVDANTRPLPSFRRADLERQVRTGPNDRLSLFCALKDRLEQEARLRRSLPGSDALTHGAPSRAVSSGGERL